MARIVQTCDGAEFGGLHYWDTVSGVTNSTAQKNYGDRAYYFNEGHNAEKNLPSAISEIYVRFYWRINTFAAFGHYNQLFTIRNGATIEATLAVNGSRYIEIYRGDRAALLDTGGTQLVVGTWYCIEVHYKIDDVSGEFNVRLDTVSECTFSGDTKPGADTDFDRLHWRLNLSTSASTGYLDDIAANDTTGGSDDSWIGLGGFLIVLPDGNGDVSQLTGQDGDSTDNYLNVDEEPPDDDTTYNYDSVVDQYDLYTLADFTLPAGEEIVSIIPSVIARKTTADADEITTVFKHGGTEYTGSDEALTTSYKQYNCDRRTTDPGDAGAWAEADIDAMQMGPKVR